jgi:uncharacterized protein (TIGR02246 family)
MRKINWLLALLVAFVMSRCIGADTNEQAIRAINEAYVNAWLQNDKEGVLNLFEDNATLAPSGLNPVKGKAAMAKFWFPNDSSVTTIHQFSNEIQFLKLDLDMAYTTQNTFLSWSYVKGEFKLARNQWGIATTIYRKQQDESWKIIHQMWKDIKTEDQETGSK